MVRIRSDTQHTEREFAGPVGHLFLVSSFDLIFFFILFVASVLPLVFSLVEVLSTVTQRKEKKKKAAPAAATNLYTRVKSGDLVFSAGAHLQI